MSLTFHQARPSVSVYGGSVEHAVSRIIDFNPAGEAGGRHGSSFPFACFQIASDSGVSLRSRSSPAPGKLTSMSTGLNSGWRSARRSSRGSSAPGVHSVVALQSAHLSELLEHWVTGAGRTTRRQDAGVQVSRAPRGGSG